jgi:CDP-diacylglycerol---serine O-phosphatidyltransferase
MDQTPPIEVGARRRRRLFRRREIPVRMLVPNFFTLLSLCAGLTAIRMGLEGRYELSVAFVVAAGLLDAVDGRAARWLKAQSRFGAELDSLADFVNFGVAPALIIYCWCFKDAPAVKGFGWITVLVFAAAMGLRLARFNSMLDVEKPKWKNGYFTGMPAPAGAITVLLPLYLDGAGLLGVRAMPLLVALYTLVMAFLLVSTIPTFSGKNLGGKVRWEYALPMLVAVALAVALLATYPFEILVVVTVGYLALIPFSYRQYRIQTRVDEAEAARASPGNDGRVVDLRPTDAGKR